MRKYFLSKSLREVCHTNKKGRDIFLSMSILMKLIAEGDLELYLTPGSTQQFMYYLTYLSSSAFLFLKFTSSHYIFALIEKN